MILFEFYFLFIIYNKTALHIAVENNSFEIVKLLLKHKKININAIDNAILKKKSL